MHGVGVLVLITYGDLLLAWEEKGETRYARIRLFCS